MSCWHRRESQSIGGGRMEVDWRVVGGWAIGGFSVVRGLGGRWIIRVLSVEAEGSFRCRP